MATLGLTALSAACFTAPAGPPMSTGTLHYAVDSGFAALTADGGETLEVTLDDVRAVCLGSHLVGGADSHQVRLTLHPGTGRRVTPGTYFIGARGGQGADLDLLFQPDADVTASGQIELARVAPDVAGHLKAGFAWSDGGSAGTFDFDFEAAFCPAR